ncbi:MAG: hypothetical protein M1816_004449 [Peltula sp. TS41687]|nr:MAG: hypothetical protein M1816_004449 [Peltula sp. TS41687]
MGSIISKLFKPFNFTPWPVTIFSTLIYAALLISLLIVHLVVPSAPQNPVPFRGINISEAWLDLQILTNGFRPYNSRRNDEVRDWLLRRIETIIDENKSQSTVEDGQMNRCELAESSTLGLHPRDYNGLPILRTQQALCENDGVVAEAIIYNDLVSNVTFSSGGGLSSSGRARNDGQSVYFEGTNIIVYIRGSEDDQYWPNSTAIESGSTVGGVLVNAHYDSVSTGFGATDDGVGVVTALQLIKYYTTPGKAPMKGLVILLNNGEEDFLNGARAFTRHPMSEYPHTFLNLEGAGAGGRATLFRSTDMEVTRFYANSPYPFGSVLSADGFKRGLIRSQTDYIVFNDVLGLRGLDVAFMEPRARYHTDQDDTRHTRRSIGRMIELERIVEEALMYMDEL